MNSGTVCDDPAQDASRVQFVNTEIPIRPEIDWERVLEEARLARTPASGQGYGWIATGSLTAAFSFSGWLPRQ